MSMKGPRRMFFEENGGKENKYVVIGGWVLFENGAKCESSSYGALVDPPPDPVERHGVRLRYYEELLRIDVAKFDEMKAQLKFQAQESIKWADANTPPQPPTDSEIRELEAQRDKVRKRQRDVAKVRKELEESKPGFLKQRQARAEASLERNSAALRSVDAIKI